MFKIKFNNIMITLPLEGIIHKLSIGIQSLPLIHFFIIPFYHKFLFRFNLTPILKIIFLIFAYMTGITLILMLYEFFFLGIYDRVIFFLRQFISFLLGIVFFIFVRYLFISYGEKPIFDTVIKTTYIILFFVMLDIINGYPRVMGTFSEPSHLGQYISFILIPLLIINYQSLKKTNLFFLIIFTVFIGVMAFSSTFFIRVFLLMLGIILFSKNIKLKLFTSIFVIFVMLTIFYILPLIFPGNYLNNMITYTLVAFENNYKQSASLVDRASFFIILYELITNMNYNSKTFFGYGFGGDTLYYPSFISNEVSDIILSVKNYFSIVSLVGKIFIYSGIIGLFLYLYLVYLVFKIAKNLFNSDYKIMSVLFAIFAYTTFGLGVFTFTELWFWLAYVDSKYIIRRREK